MTAMKLAGLVALSDPPRKDSAGLVSQLHDLGIRTVMATGDAAATAAIVAKAVGTRWRDLLARIDPGTYQAAAR